MTKVEAYKADDGTLHETFESAQNADAKLAYKQRVAEFIRESPSCYEGTYALESWLLTDKGHDQVLRLAGVA